MISFQTVSLRYGDKQVLDQFTLDIPTDQITCLHGPSGSGKTTLLRILAGLVTPDSGTITGRPQKPAMLFQEDRLLPHFTAAENIAAVLPKSQAAEARIWLDRVGLAQDAALHPGELSGGMCRRVALARALAYGRDFLLLDEPFTGLDMALTEQMAALIRKTGLPALVVTHSLAEIELLGGRLLAVDGPPLRVSNA
ncbi:MAG: ATP-binding cassette domain-containing protein [Oscillospiraceae bacterium]|nr:ATP-binding cassette domain-containing protein [Oscillospiraceae bacterium]